jgi:hypothetical protein
MKHIGYLVISGMLLTACEREAQVDLPPHQSKLVINAQQAQNRLFSIRVSRSVGITETILPNEQQFNISNAFVLLKQNDIIVDTLKYNSSNNRYEGKRTRSASGNRYTVEAAAPGYLTAEGMSELPSLLQPVSVSLKRNARTGASGEALDEISIKLNDDGSKSNYYLLRVRQATGEYANCIQTNDKDVERLVYSDPFDTEECLDGNRLLFADKNFNGSTKTVILYVNTYEMNEFTNSQGRKLKPTIELLHITEDYFRYIKSVNAYDNATDNPFAEPVNLLTNIKNGYGFFTTFALAVDTLR